MRPTIVLLFVAITPGLGLGQGRPATRYSGPMLQLMASDESSHYGEVGHAFMCIQFAPQGGLPKEECFGFYPRNQTITVRVQASQPDGVLVFQDVRQGEALSFSLSLQDAVWCWGKKECCNNLGTPGRPTPQELLGFALCFSYRPETIVLSYASAEGGGHA